jgi:protein-disulfide isomerase
MVTMSRVLVGFAVLLVLWEGPARGGVASLEEALSETIMGRADAPVTIIEYASLTCPYCATFHREILPQIKKAYIDTGKVRLLSRDFPLDGLALAAAVLTRCVGRQRYFGFLEVLFRSQVMWSRAQNPRAELIAVARMGGLSATDFDACLKNEALVKAIQERANAARQKFGIESTPTFIIDGRKVSGVLPFAEFQAILDKALESKQ